MQALLINPQTPDAVAFTPDQPEPTIPAGEVLIRVHLAGICSTDLELARGYMNFTGIPGHEFVGTVVAGPPHLLQRRVVAEINCVCGECDLCRRGLPTHCRRRTVLGIFNRNGAFAQLVAVPERNCRIVPDEISDQQAVFVEPLAAAAHVLSEHPFDAGTRTAVIGTGRLGLLVAQVLALQPCRLDVIGRNPRTLALCRKRGLNAVSVEEARPAAAHDVVVDCTGSPDGLRLAMQLVRPRGLIVLKSTYATPEPVDLAPLVIHEIRVAGSRCGPFPAALQLLRERKIEVDELVNGVYPLRRGAEAFAAARAPENVKILLQPDPN